jgi:hypothetical protein
MNKDLELLLQDNILYPNMFSFDEVIKLLKAQRVDIFNELRKEIENMPIKDGQEIYTFNWVIDEILYLLNKDRLVEGIKKAKKELRGEE